MSSVRKRQQVAKKIASVARSRYGELKRRKARPPLEQLVLSILWRHTSVGRGTRVLRALKRAFVDWNEVRVSSTLEVSGAISGAGWASACAARIKEVLWALFTERNVLSLDFLADMPLSQARSELMALPGVTRDLADEVLLFSLGADILPLSADAARMCRRLGLIPNERPTVQNQRALMDMWQPDVYPIVALFFADYARTVCRAEKPRHRDCPLEGLCARTGLREAGT